MSNTSVVKRFIGKWVLDVGASKFEVDKPPKQATLSVEAEKGGLFMRTEWRDPEDKKGEIEHSLSFDKPVLVNGVEVTLHVGEDESLETVMAKDGVEVARTTRTLSKDGKTLELVQTGTLPDKRQYTNRSTFRRGG